MMLLRGRRSTAGESAGPEQLARELQRRRELAAARQADELERARAEAGHDRARQDVAEEARLAELARAEREADVRAEAELARMFRQFRASGERTRIKADMARSGEARALRLEWLRTRNLRVLIPVLIGFGIWSTTGVQQGAARIMDVQADSPVWWALWGLEALLIGAVCWIIIVRARLAASGGKPAGQAERIGVGCLTTSIFLNLVAAIPAGDASHVSGWAVVGAMFAHALGPVGAAVTAHLIGVIDRSISEADPWHDAHGRAVPRLAEMDLRRSVPLAAEGAAVGAPAGALGSARPSADHTSESAAGLPAVVWPVTAGRRRVLPVIARPESFPVVAEEEAPGPRTGVEQPREQKAKAARKPRPNKGVPVPESAKPAPRALSDGDLCERMVAAIDRGELPEGASIRQVQSALGVGFGRAKRIKELYGRRLADMKRAVVQALPEHDEPPARAELVVVAGDNDRTVRAAGAGSAPAARLNGAG